MHSILLVDDDLSVRETLGEALATLGVRVVGASSIRDASTYAETMEEVALLVCSDELLDGTALELYMELARRFELMQCIVLAHQSHADTVVAHLRARVFDYFLQPVDDVFYFVDACRRAIEERSRRLQEKRGSLQLQRNIERYRLAVRGASEGLWDWDLATGELYLAPRWKAMLGYGEVDVNNSEQGWFELIHPEDAERVRAELAAHLEGARDAFVSEYRIRHRDKAYRWVLARGLAVRDEQGRATRVSGSQLDITDRKAMEEQLQDRMFKDPVTSLPNRALLLDRLGRALAKHNLPQAQDFAVVIIDLDNFKKVNEGLTPSAGDTLLRHVGQRLLTLLGPHDTLARMGGDEFAALFEGSLSSQTALQFAENIPSKLRQAFRFDRQDVFVSASVGIAFGSAAYKRSEDVVRDGVIAVNRAKAAGGGTSAVFEPRMHTHARAVLSLDSSLRRAVEREEFVAHYQPIYSLPSRRVCGFESLARWRHPTRGLMYPTEFLRLSEQNGTITAIGEWCIRRGCKDLVDLTQRGIISDDVYISVNVSARHLLRSDFIDMMQSALDESGLDPKRLVAELTESIFISQTGESEANIARLEELGIRLAMDDFGTGYSSLTYLFRFPLDIIKIDRSFVSQLNVDPRHRALIEGVVQLGHALGLTITAEGIEAAEQLDHLLAYGCDSAQGFYFSKALPVEAIPELMSQATHPCPTPVSALALMDPKPSERDLQ